MFPLLINNLLALSFFLLGGLPFPAGAAPTAIQIAQTTRSHLWLQRHAFHDRGKSVSSNVILIGCPTIAMQNIYNQPGQGNQTVDWLLQGTCVIFDARTTDQRWLRIAINETQVSEQGWVAADRFVLDQKVEKLPPVAVASSPSSTGFYSPITACLKSVSSLNIRTGPGANYDAVGYLSNGDCVQLTGISPTRQWGRSERGWMSLYFLTLNDDWNKLPVIRP